MRVENVLLLLTIFKLCHFAELAIETVRGEETLIGWKGETYERNTRKNGGVGGTTHSWVQQIATEPRAFVHHNFLSAAECERLKRLSAPKMKRSAVVGTNGSSVVQEYRTSYGTFLNRLSDPVINSVSNRVAMWMHLPPVHQEDMQVLRYAVSQKYGEHMDSLIDESPRLGTVLIYLSDVEEGGETVFTSNSRWLTPDLPERFGPFSDCVDGDVAFRPRKGSALLFYSINPDGTHDPASMHAGCPVIKGVKWTATIWVHSMPFRPDTYKAVASSFQDPGLCKDNHESCSTWGDNGECKKNKAFMETSCAATCKFCTVCRDGDKQCLNHNREAAGYLVYNETEFGG